MDLFELVPCADTFNIVQGPCPVIPGTEKENLLSYPPNASAFVHCPAINLSRYGSKACRPLSPRFCPLPSQHGVAPYDKSRLPDRELSGLE